MIEGSNPLDILNENKQKVDMKDEGEQFMSFAIQKDHDKKKDDLE